MTDTITEHRDDPNAIQSALNVTLARLTDDVMANAVEVDIVTGGSNVMDTEPVTIEREPYRVEVSVRPVEPPVVIPPDPPIDPGPTPPVVIPDTHTPIYVSPDGSDTGDGATEGEPVTLARAKVAAYNILDTTAKNVAFLFERGKEFGDFGRTVVKESVDAPVNPDWPGKTLNGAIFAAYGTGPNPIFVGTGATAFVVRPWCGSLTWRNIDARGWGSFVTSLTNTGGITIDGCYSRGRGISINPGQEAGGRSTGFTLRDSIIQGYVLQPGAKHSVGIFVDRTDDITLVNNIVCDWGFDINGEGSALSQGVYITGESSPVVLAQGNLFFHNAGAGAQFRCGGVILDNFAGWNGARGMNVGQTLGAKTREIGGTCDVRGNVSYEEAAPGIAGGAAMAFGNLSSGSVVGNTMVNHGINEALLLDAAHGSNHHDGLRVGLNNLDFAQNYVHGGLRLEYDGWGIEDPSDDNAVTLDTTNTIGGGVEAKPTYNNPDGKLRVEAPTNADTDATRLPPLTDELKAKFIAREITTAQLIQTYQKH